VDSKPFARELALLPELPLREKKVSERLRDLPVDAVVELLHDLVRLAETGDDDARIALLACVGLQRYEKDLGYERLAAFYAEADQHGYEDVKRLLTTSEVRRRAGKGGPRENPFVEKTLGERKSLARGSRNRDLLDRMLFERNPEVMRVLLNNPRIIERDVVKVAAMRPSSPALLAEIVRSPRWAPNYTVKKALASNPYFPVNDAISLLTFLAKQDLEDLAGALDIHERVATAARSLLEKRRRGGGSEEPPLLDS
jgi:hypothetical protein